MADNTQDADHLRYVSSPVFANQGQMAEPRPAVLDQRFRQFPQITSFSQLQGMQGSTVSICLQSVHELQAPPEITFSLLFASKRVECALQLISDPSISPKQYAVSGEVPPFTSTGWHAFDVPLRLNMENSNVNISALTMEVGTFSYTRQILQQESSRKRRLPSDTEDPSQSPIKKLSTEPLHDQQHVDRAVYNTSPYSPFVSTTGAGCLPQNGKVQQNSPRPSGHHYSTSGASAASVKAPSPHTPPSWSPNFTSVNQANPVPTSLATPVPGSKVEVPIGKTPALIRTSTIQQSSASMSPAAAVSHTFNPYAMYPSKALLKLNGDLDSMVDNWTLEEFDAKRRLVQFTRRQHGSTIHADFSAIAPEDRQPNSICISCIRWEEKSDYYVTSVDTIFLLESLVAVRFTVEEKNRIRRNLEGFRPLTVSKSKADSEEFFKVIMGFPSPKPRNIEKDVKVFPWKILAHALKKIIGKYSASYSSTASALPTPMGSHYNSNGASDSGTEIRGSTSPPLNGVNNGASPYTLPAGSFSPHLSHQAMPVPITNAPRQDLRLHVPSLMPGYSYPATHSQEHVSQNFQALRRSPQPMTAPPATGRIINSWDGGDYTAFANGHEDANTNMNAYGYNRIVGSMPASQSYMPATSYSISHSGV